MRRVVLRTPRFRAAVMLLLWVAAATAGCAGGAESGAVPPSAAAVPVQPPPQQADRSGPAPPDGAVEASAEEAVPQRIVLAPGVSAQLTAGVWESGPAAWLEVTSNCEDLLLFEGRQTSGGEVMSGYVWVYWRSDDALPWEQVTIADSFGEFGWGTPSDASLVAPERISVRTEWIEVVSYERWPVPGPSQEPGESAMGPADGFAFIARTVAPAGFLGAGSVIIGDRSDSDHDPRQFLETLELDLQVLIDSCR
jgi:hypothetical protein